MSRDIGKIEDILITACSDGESARAVIQLMDGIRAILNAPCEGKDGTPPPGCCWPCLLRAARDGDE